MGIQLDGRNIPQIYLGKNKLFDVTDVPKRPIPEVVKDNLILHYDFSQGDNNAEDRGVIKDLSGNGNDGVLHNFDYSEESGYVENGLMFDGIDDEIKFDDIAIAGNEDFTIELSVKESFNVDSLGYIFGDGDDDYNTHSGTYITFYDGRVNFRLPAKTTGVSVSNTSDTDASYSFRSKEKEVNSFGQGVLSTTYGTYGPISDVEAVAIFNNIGHADYVNRNYFHGIVSSIRIYKRGLTNEEIQYNYKSDREKYFSYIPQYTPIGLKTDEKDISLVMRGDRAVYPNTVQDGLRLWYDFRSMAHDPFKETVARDLSGNHNHGNLNGFKFDGTDGYMNKGLMFNGEGSEVNFPKITFAGDADWTVEIVTSGDYEETFYIMGSKSSFNGYIGLSSLNASNRIRLSYSIPGASVGSFIPITHPLHTVVSIGSMRLMTRDASSYSDDRSDSYLLEEEFESVFDNLGNAYRYNNNFAYHGLIYAVRIYDRALTQEEVMQNHIIDKARYGL